MNTKEHPTGRKRPDNMVPLYRLEKDMILTAKFVIQRAGLSSPAFVALARKAFRIARARGKKPKRYPAGEMILLAVDPSLHACGFAFYNAFQPGLDYHDLESGAWHYGVVHPKGRDRLEKWRHALWSLSNEAGDWPVTHLVIEWPIFFATERGKIAASRGHTLEIAGLAGFAAGHYRLAPDHVTF